MTKSDLPPWRPETLAVRAGTKRAHQETSEALYLNSGYAYDGPDQAAARFTGDDPGYIYSRFSNPTVEMFEDRLAALEGAGLDRPIYCSATATGMAAVTAAVLCQMSAGDHIVASRALFGSCRYVAADLCTRFGIETTFIDGTDLDQWRSACRPETKLFFLETPSNPGLEILDLAAIGEIARESGARLLVDNVFASPILQQPFQRGADIVVYSATKHIDGQGRVLGGAILSDDQAFMQDTLQPFLRNTGPSLSPFNAWVLLKSLETLGLRVRAMTESANTLATRVAAQFASPAQQPASNGILVTYPGLGEGRATDIVRRQMTGGGSLFTLNFAGEQAAAFAFLSALRLFDVSNNLGDAKSLATHPWTTTHSRLSEEDRLVQGVTPGLVRLSVGLEHVEDLWADLAAALEQALHSAG